MKTNRQRLIEKNLMTQQEMIERLSLRNESPSEISLDKWERLNKLTYEEYNHLPLMAFDNNTCALCQIYHNSVYKCKKCPISLGKSEGCSHPNHPWKCHWRKDGRERLIALLKKAVIFEQNKKLPLSQRISNYIINNIVGRVK